MAKMTLFGMTPGKAAVKGLMIGAGAAAVKIGCDALGDRLFVQTAADAAAQPRNANSVKMYEAYRGLTISAGGMLAGGLIWKKSREAAFAIVAGALISGLDRIFTAYDVKRQIRNLFSDSAHQQAAASGLYGQQAGAPQLGDGRDNYVGPLIRKRVPMQQTA